MGNCLGGEKAHSAGGTEHSSEYGSSHIGTITGRRYSTVRLENLYQMDGLIGRGQSGIISLCHNKRTGAKFACKSLYKKSMRSEGTFDETRREVQVLGMLKGHPNVVQLEGVFEDETAVHIVMELCTGGCLTEHIATQGEYSERAASALMQTVLEVVRYCHTLGIIHRDLKLSNFLMSDDTDNAVLKAIDFGSAAFCEFGESLTKMAGTALYVAPEVLDEKYSFPCDIWSCGVMLYIMLCGRPPFQGDNVLKVFDAVKTQKPDLESEPWPLISTEAKAVISAMLHKDPRKRPTAEELLMYQWIQGKNAADAPLAAIILPRMKHFSKMSNLRHLALLVTSQFLPEDQMASVHAVFESVDEAGSGELSLEEVRAALKKVGAHMRDDEVDALFKSADVNHSGTVSYTEFVAATVVISKEKHGEALRRTFQSLDKKGEGRIRVEDFAQFCVDHKLGQKDEIMGLLKDIGHAEGGKEGGKEDGEAGEKTIDYNAFVDIVTGKDTTPDNEWNLNLL